MTITLKHRKSIRLKEYDYSMPGEYFVTICTHRHECTFGEIVGEEISLNENGIIAQETWRELINHVGNIALDEFVIMPNHFHGIILIMDDLVGAGSEPAPTLKRFGLPEIIRQFKTFSSKRINEHRRTIGTPVWQRNYYEHIIRNEKELNNIRDYIAGNVLQWTAEHAYELPENIK